MATSPSRGLTTGGGEETISGITFRKKKNEPAGDDDLNAQAGPSNISMEPTSNNGPDLNISRRESWINWPTGCRDSYGRPQIIPIDNFSGDGYEDVENFIDNIEDAAEIQQWDPEVTFHHAASHMVGSARRWLRIHSRENTTWPALKYSLRRDFGTQQYQGELENKLDLRAFREGESYLRYTEDVIYLCNK